MNMRGNRALRPAAAGQSLIGVLLAGCAFAPALAQSSAEPARLDEVVVTASKGGATSLQKTPIAITALTSGATIGQAVVCPVVRYASVLWQVSAQIERRHPESVFWQTIAAELDQLEAGHELPRASLAMQLLVPEALRSSCGLRLVSRPAFASDRPAAVTAELDRYIWHLSDSPS